MSGLPEGYGYKDLTPLGRALDTIDILEKKLKLATDFLTFHLIHEYDIDEYNMYHKQTCRKCAANKVLKEIDEIK